MNNNFSKNKKGSSETIREAFNFNFSKYIENKPEHIKNIDQSFLEWFIGFTEGDGSFIVSLKKNKTRKNIFFFINQKDPKLMYKIKKELGFGQVIKYKQNNQTFYRYSVSDIKNINRLIHLFNGNLILKKVQNRFNKWLNCYNNLYPNEYIENKFNLPTLNLNSGWLSGFIDAEGCFYANVVIKKDIQKQIYSLPKMKKNWSNEDYQFFKEISQSKCRISQKMTLTQISIKETNELFKKIIFLFKGKSFYIFKNSKVKKLTNKEYARIEFSNLDSHKIIIDYLSQYKLKTLKYISFIKWKKIYLRRKKGVHLSPKGTQRLYRLIKSINNK
jgi:hypothetical protein